MGGENAGRVLSHDGVVRQFIVRPRGDEDSGWMNFPVASKPNHPRRVVVFVQDPQSLEILAAAGAAF
jgi:hypothetical protein